MAAPHRALVGTVALFLAGTGVAAGAPLLQESRIHVSTHSGFARIGASASSLRLAALEDIRAVPQATCGQGDRPEQGLQGQVPLAERTNVFGGYSCNLRLKGQYEGQGASWQMASLGRCAYFSQADKFVTVGDSSDANPAKADLRNPGTAVVDVRDSRRPRPTAFLNTPGMNDSWESIETNSKRSLLASAEEAGPGFAVYDISGDCTRPRKLFAGDLTGQGHAGGLTADGKTYWSGPSLRAIDLTDPRRPKVIHQESGGGYTTHDLGISNDGTRLYLAQSDAPNSLKILDVSDFQHRKPNPKIRELSQLTWADGSLAQNALPVSIAGRRHLIFTDEMGAIGFGTPQAACARHLPPFGMGRIIDISNERKPRVVSRLALEVTLPKNCASTLADTSGQFPFGYDSHYCTADDPGNTRLVACSYLQSGLRVFDVRDPAEPREVAYYNPPMKPGYKAGSNYNATGIGSPNGADWSPAHPQFRLDRNEIWFTSQMNGLQVLTFTPGASALLSRSRQDR